MTNRELFKKMQHGFDYDDIWDEEADLFDWLDNLAEIGVPGASEMFIALTVGTSGGCVSVKTEASIANRKEGIGG